MPLTFPFPDGRAFDADPAAIGVVIRGYDEAAERLVRCTATVDALRAHFGLKSSNGIEALAVFDRHRPAIEAAASQAYRPHVPRVILRAIDFRQGVSPPD